jgi:UDP-N-acetylmuramoyl-L-alanyl-D-glutamate--2,6-diaminopimelate ligase
MFEAMDDDSCWSDGRHEMPCEPEMHVRRGRGVRLSELFPTTRFVACDDILATGCHDDPDACGPGDVFVARLTGHGDGHELVARAIARGVSGIVAERIIPTFGTPLCIVPDSAWALARLTQSLAGDPTGGMRVIAITGTSGKTTTAWLAAAVLSEAGLRVGVLSDLGCLDADSTEPVAADLEEPRVLAAWLKRLAASGCTHAVVEVSSRMLARHALAGIACDTVVVTNLATAHLDDHGSVEAYHDVKARILDSLGAHGCLVANIDDERVERLAARHRGPRLTAALKRDADLTAIPVERSLHGQMVLLRSGGHVAPVTLATPVTSFARDALFAAAVGMRYRVPLERIARGLEAAGSVSGRLERLDRGQDAVVFLDRPTSGHALATTLASLRRLTPGRLVLVAEESLAERIDASRFALRAARWCDETAVVPASVLDEDAGNEAVAAYARLDRLLSSLDGRDCLVVLGEGLRRQGDPGDPGEPQASLASLVDGWLQLVHPPVWGRRRAA